MMIQRVKEKEEEWLALETESVYDIQNATKVEKFKICCKVYGIDTDWGWYYFGCGKCHHRVTKGLKKEASTKPRPKVPIWFKLHLLVEDDSAKTKFMLLDTVAAGIVTKTTSFVLNGSYDESLVGNSYKFLVGVEKEHIHYRNDTYKAHKVRKGLLILDAESANEQMVQPLGLTRRKTHYVVLHSCYPQ
ncbi:unnamed protein product [Microthlaspi erraticum]|uniref:DUF223 domain-containing protein n=1 Tax=Microthlaspi erraticum TaxID=1685480 RepID=A0A6D2HXH5_9BRAS|nr:unnamed protein product [Microthlaspi erraticum]